MRGRNFKGSTMVQGRQYAIGVLGTTIAYQCGRQGHTYNIDHGKKPLHRRLGPDAARMMASWWSYEKGGCVGECPKCEKEAKLAKEGKLKLKIDEEIARVGAVLTSRGVNVDKMLQDMRRDHVKPEDQLKGLVGALYDGLAYGNWPQ